MIADTSNGVEPMFAVVFEKRVTVGRFFYTNKIFESTLKENGLYNDDILTKIANNYGSVRGLSEIPEWIQKIFVTAIDVHWTDHIMAQAVWQKWISNAIAKTINMPGDTTAEDVKSAYLLSHELGLKGVTVYRDGSRHEQVLHINGNDTKERKFIVRPSEYTIDYLRKGMTNPYVKEQIEHIFDETDIVDEVDRTDISSPKQIGSSKKILQPFSLNDGGLDEMCPSCKARLIITEGCNMCIECGFSSCVSG
jgi:ribonucleoside-diphosphate reductase alpha chain